MEINIQTISNTKNEEILNIRLVDLLCKHVLIHPDVSDKAEKVLQFSNQLDYPYCLWGVHSGHANDIGYHINRLHKMEVDNFSMPIRIVKCKYPFSDKYYYWADNLHSTIKLIRQYGKDCKLSDISFYLVDISDFNKIKLSSYKEGLRENPIDIINAVQCSCDRYKWSNNQGLIYLNYTVDKFLQENPELYTKYNTNLGTIKEGDTNLEILQKVQAFNSLYEFSNDNYIGK